MSFRPKSSPKCGKSRRREGLDVATLVREATEARLRQYDSARPLTEAELLTRINRGFPETFWNRYRKLIARRRAETLTRKEQQELIGMSDQLEAWRVERLKYLIKLAEMRQTSLDALTKKLGLRPMPVE